MLNYWPKKFRWVSHLKSLLHIHLCARIALPFLFWFFVGGYFGAIVIGFWQFSLSWFFFRACGYSFRPPFVLSPPVLVVLFRLFDSISILLMFHTHRTVCPFAAVQCLFHCDIFAYVYCKCFMLNALLFYLAFFFSANAKTKGFPIWMPPFIFRNKWSFFFIFNCGPIHTHHQLSITKTT